MRGVKNNRERDIEATVCDLSKGGRNNRLLGIENRREGNENDRSTAGEAVKVSPFDRACGGERQKVRCQKVISK
jgi:hypothetical protein